LDEWRQLVEEYIRSLKSKISEIEGEARAGNYSTVRNFGHQIKGSGKLYGFPEVSTYGERIESACKSENYELVHQLLAELKRIIYMLDSPKN
jgi:HPt (histidine-containing phosphotransfer) domain-containing protein